MDENVANFVAITSCDTSRAAQYLLLTENNFEQAIQLYFDSPSLDFGPASTSSVPLSDVASPAHHPANLNSDDDPSDLHPASHASTHTAPPQPSTEDDEAMARRLQEEMYGAAGAGAADPEEVRAPMQRTTETLIEPGSSWGAPEDAEMEAMVREQLARQRAGRAGIFNQRTTQANVWDDSVNSSVRRRELATATGGASEQSSKMNMLAELFRPPFEIMFQSTWEKARDTGREEEKWLLVNIQDPAIFDCQRLNRDIWRNNDIKATVRENFIFMQYAKDDPRGEQYINYYFHARDSSDAYPHIAIVDPRTGEQVKVWSGPPVPEAVDFHAQLHEFLDRYSLDLSAKNPVARRKAESRKMDVDRMTEEEMLEMALQNSLDNGRDPKQDDPDALTKSFDDIKGKKKAEESASEAVEVEAESGSNSAFDQISSHNPQTEPSITDPKVTTRIQFRGPTGRPIVRRFHLSDPVRRIYEWIKADNPWEGKQGTQFDLAFMGKNLMEELDSSVEQAGLKGASVMVEFTGEE